MLQHQVRDEIAVRRFVVADVRRIEPRRQVGRVPCRSRISLLPVDR
jgi:hypothetical protein